MRSRCDNKHRVKVDARNRKLLQLLAANARRAASEMASALRLSREVVTYRLNRLQETGVLQGYSVVPSLPRFGYRLYRICMLIDESDKALHAKLLETLVGDPRTYALLEYSDTWDLCWEICCHTVEDFDNAQRMVRTEFAKIMLGIEASIVLRTLVDRAVPYKQQPSPNVPHANTYPLIDEHDKALLQALGKHGRASSYELGKLVGLSGDAVLKRMKRLHADGIITGYVPIVNLAALGYSWYTYVMRFASATDQDEAKLREFAAQHPHIIRAMRTYGRWDVHLTIVVEKPEHYHQTVKEIKNAFAANMRKYEAWSVHKEYTCNPLPLALLNSSS